MLRRVVWHYTTAISEKYPPLCLGLPSGLFPSGFVSLPNLLDKAPAPTRSTFHTPHHYVTEGSIHQYPIMSYSLGCDEETSRLDFHTTSPFHLLRHGFSTCCTSHCIDWSPQFHAIHFWARLKWTVRRSRSSRL
jgi:hypothetical protein